MRMVCFIDVFYSKDCLGKSFGGTSQGDILQLS